MAQRVIAQGGGRELERFKQALSSTSGEGVTTIEVDVPDKPVLREIVRGSLSAMDVSLRAIPGVHLAAPSTYSAQGGTATIRVQVTTNPLPLIPIAVATIVLGVAAIVGVVSWRILKASPAEFALIIGVLLLGVAAAIFLFRRM